MKFKRGDRVNHKMYGDGTVLGYGGKISGVEFDKENRLFHEAGTLGRHAGRNYHCWFVEEGELTLITAKPSWNLNIHPAKGDPDITFATLTVDGVKREFAVKRFHKDSYSRDEAIKAIVAKMMLSDCSTSAVGETVKLTAWTVHPTELNICRGRDGNPEPVKEYPAVKRCYTCAASKTRAVDWPCSFCVGFSNWKAEPVPPIMINGKELKVGSKLILKPYDKVEKHCYISETSWGCLLSTIISVENTPSRGNTEFNGHSSCGGRWAFDISAIDRILED